MPASFPLPASSKAVPFLAVHLLPRPTQIRLGEDRTRERPGFGWPDASTDPLQDIASDFPVNPFHPEVSPRQAKKPAKKKAAVKKKAAAKKKTAVKKKAAAKKKAAPKPKTKTKAAAKAKSKAIM